MRLSKEEHTAIIAQLSYDLEPVTPLPDWNAIAMELVHMCNEREDMVKRLEEAREVISRVNDKARMNAGELMNAREFARHLREEARAFLAGGE